MKIRRRRKFVILFIILFISIGFAYITANLSINAVYSIMPKHWDVHFENVEFVDKSINLAQDDFEPVISQDRLSVSTKLSFKVPGDYYTFYIDVVNDGDVAAAVENIYLSNLTAQQKRFVAYSIKYIDGIDVQVDDVLPANSRETYEVTFSYGTALLDEDMNIDINNLSAELNFNFKYVSSREVQTATFAPGAEVSRAMAKLSDPVAFETLGYNGSNGAKVSKLGLNPKNMAQNFPSTADKVKGILKSQYLDSNYNYQIVSDEDSDGDIYMWFAEDTAAGDGSGFIYWYSYAEVVYLNEDSSFLLLFVDETNNWTVNFSNLSDISGLARVNTSNVTNLSGAFAYTSPSSLKYLRNWDVSNVDSFYGMFLNSKITSLKGLELWNVENATDFTFMFYGCAMLDNISSISSWNTGSANSFVNMFSATAISNISALSNWHVSNVASFYGMFYECANLTDATDLNDWDVDADATFTTMFDDRYIVNKPTWYNS